MRLCFGLSGHLKIHLVPGERSHEGISRPRAAPGVEAFLFPGLFSLCPDTVDLPITGNVSPGGHLESVCASFRERSCRGFFRVLFE